MDIQEFVHETLRQIVGGVNAAKDKNEGIAPDVTVMHGSKMPNNPLVADFGQEVIHFIEFDLAVTVSEKKDVGGGAGLAVASVFSVGGNKSSASETMTANRIRFMVPISYKRMSGTKSA